MLSTDIVCFQEEGAEENAAQDVLSKEQAVGMLNEDTKHEEGDVTDSDVPTTTEIDKLLQELADDPEGKESSFTESITSATDQSTVHLTVDEQEADEHHVGHEETEDQSQKQVNQTVKEVDDDVGYGGSHDTSNDDDKKSSTETEASQDKKDDNEINGSASKLKNFQVAIVCLIFPIAHAIYSIV